MNLINLILNMKLPQNRAIPVRGFNAAVTITERARNFDILHGP